MKLNEDLFLKQNLTGNELDYAPSVAAVNANLAPKTNNAGFHNSIYRGKDLTNVYTLAQISAKVSAGTFDDLYIGDYITTTLNGTKVTFRMAGFDCYYGTGDSSCTTHHIVMVPDTFGSYQMNSSNVTTDGYKGSAMWTSTIPTLNTYLNSAIGSSHVLSYKQLVSNKVTNEVSVEWEWISCPGFSLMSEVNVYGSTVWSSSGYDVGIDCKQFPLFTLNPYMIQPNRTAYWLKAVRSASYFCVVDGSGLAHSTRASASYGFRGFFLFK